MFRTLAKTKNAARNAENKKQTLYKIKICSTQTETQKFTKP